MKKQLYNFITKSDWRWNALDNNERRTVLLVCCLIPFSAMNIAMFNVALPDIVADFQVRFGAASWVVTVFGILYAVGALVYGKLADRIGLLLFPGAVVSSAIGYFGGKIIDQRGSRAVLTMGVMSTGAGLMLLSSLSGYPVWGIALCLVLTNAGYMLMQPALAKWVSGTLAKGETGIDMGVYSLNNFLSTAMTGAVAAKALEHVGPVAVNPLAVSGMSGVYSNVYFGFFVLALLQGGLVYRMRFSRPDVQPAPMPSDRDPAFHERHSRPQK
jgi:MFS family permease